MSFFDDVFWPEYPKKVGKKQSRIECDKCLKAGVSEDRIMDGLRAYKMDKEDWRPWRDPERFLKHHLFDDYADAKKVAPKDQMRVDDNARRWRKRYEEDPEYWGRFDGQMRLYRLGPYAKENENVR